MGQIVCPYCKESLDQYSHLRCVRCGTPHHQICWVENENHCSVFRCAGNYGLRSHNRANNLVILWCVLNYGLHLSLRLIGDLTHSAPLSDVWVVLILESIVIATGLAIVRLRSSSEAFRTFGLLLFAGNTLFLSLLGSHYLAHGFERLNALIRL